ncbi:hypothetical protein AYL99_11715 [Fonsecaea erecta]|uniref:Integrase zinc-binding domain-containing protein n=1 Tax=Fonsecaea erecta TaxID=1367422 RepID=A0A178Z340_9EURO|nr:hypothetical protein AYL99_11715 [Fonsecaea erecta]OAP54180.1 hypothetical protein AYL99_11715 [Fonsecaea erecta]
MADQTPRSSHDYNSFSQSQYLAMSPYSDGPGLSYPDSDGQVGHQFINSFAGDSPSYTPVQATSATLRFLPPTSVPQVSVWRNGTIRRRRLLPRPRALPSMDGTECQISLKEDTVLSKPALPPFESDRRLDEFQQLARPRDSPTMEGTECQDSPNEDTMLSEPVLPPLEGYPDVHEFDEMLKRFLQGLSPARQEKTIFPARQAAEIKRILIDEAAEIGSVSYRNWVRKAFTLEHDDSEVSEHLRKICSNGKPVVVQEKLFKILTKAHKQCQHGGKVRTFAEVKKVYSRVPEVLVDRFIKMCPTCYIREEIHIPSPDPVKVPETNTEAHVPQAISAEIHACMSLSRLLNP